MIIFIFGHRWFNRREGNTYHSVTVTVVADGIVETFPTSEITYGYGLHYEQTALELLQTRGLVPADAALHRWAADNDVTIDSRVVDVARKADL